MTKSSALRRLGSWGPHSAHDVTVRAWILASALYLVLLWTVGIATLRRGHYALFFIGIVLPVVWIVGALIPPTADVIAARQALQSRR
jgi:hypothetical protein